MAIYCPHCQSPVEPTTDLAGEIVCTVCGSSFRVANSSTIGWQPGEGSRKLGGFELLELVGSGAFGSVFKARDPKLDRLVAVKVPRVGALGGPEERDRLIREARSVAQLSHPVIVPVHEVGEHDGTPFLVSEFVQGVTLSDQLTARRLSVEEAARLVAVVARALHYAHEQGVVHRDIKPSNVMLDAAGLPRLMDFGLAKRDASEITVTLEGQVLGTPAYMSPEQARGEAHKVDGRSDVYSLGVVLYQLLTGELPFRGNVRMMLHQVLTDEPRLPRALNDRVPRDLQTVCLKAMAKESERRYPTAAAFADDLEAWLNNQPIQARPPSAWYRWRMFAARNRALVGGVLATFLALLLGVAGMSWAWWHARVEKDRADAARADAEREEGRSAKLLAQSVKDKTALTEANLETIATLARTHAAAARLAAQRGEWQEASKQYQLALSLLHEDPVGLWLGKLECRLALYEYDKFRTELANLAKHFDLGRHAGAVRLLQAHAVLTSTRRESDPVPLIREAIDLGLPEADRAFAEAMLAPTVPEATVLLQKAVAADPYHRRAYEMLATMLFIQGRVKEMRPALERVRMLSPNSVNALMLQAMADALDDDLPAAYRSCEQLRPSLGADGVSMGRTMCRVVRTFTREEFLWSDNPLLTAGPLILEFSALAPRLSKMLGEGRFEEKTWHDFAYYRLPFMRDLGAIPLAKNIGTPEWFLKLGDSRLMADSLGRLTRSIPNGVYHYLHGLFLYKADQVDDAIAAYRRAIAAPSYMRVDRKARFELVKIQTERARTLAGPLRWELEDEARRNLRRLAVDGTYPPWACDWLCFAAWQLGEADAQLALSEAWLRQRPGDKKALRARLDAEFAVGAYGRAVETARELLREQPDSEILNYRGVAEYRRGNYRASLASMQEVQQKDPRNDPLLHNLAAIEDQLRRTQAQTPILLEKLRLGEALALARRGDHAQAVAVADPLPPERNPGGDTRVARACVFALAAAAAKQDKILAERYAARAVAELTAARKEGYFKDPYRVEFLTGEHDLDGLRQRADYRAVSKVE